jgi:hypothetical protein
MSYFSTSFSTSVDQNPAPSAPSEITPKDLGQSTAQQVITIDESQLPKSSSESVMSEIVAPIIVAEGEDSLKLVCEEKVSRTSDVLLLVFFYTACITACLHYSSRHSRDVASAMPWVGRSNATNIVMERLKSIETDFESHHMSDKWRVVPNAGNITVEMLDTDSLDWPLCVRVSTVLKIKPAKMYEYFQEDYAPSVEGTQPFYQSLRVLFSAGTKSSAVSVIRKVRSDEGIFSFLLV